MDKIKKFLRKLRKKEVQAFFLLMEQLKIDYKKVPGVKKVVGKNNLFRVRLGQYRLIFIVKKEKVEIVKISKRDDQTYKNL